MKSNQFCSVCKQWLEMEVVPTGDGDEDDGVVWYRCPKCQGFLPKLRSAVETEAPVEASADAPVEEPVADETPAGDAAAPVPDKDMPWDSPAEMIASQNTEASDAGAAVVADPGADPDARPGDLAGEADEPEPAKPKKDEAEPEEPAEPVAEYAARLAAVDPGTAVPYRPWDTYEEGQCIQHLAWDDCGVVVGKESLPGGRQIIKCYFEDAGVVRLIEKAPR